MYIYTENELAAYLSGRVRASKHPDYRGTKICDPIIKMLEKSSDIEMRLKSHGWMAEITAKRLTFWSIYGDILLHKNKALKVLDVAGGYSGLTKILAKNCDYTLVDILTHDRMDHIHRIITANPHKWFADRWEDLDFEGQCFDLVICNDLFPNCDQRLEMFLQQYLPICKEMRLILTFHNTPKSYILSRADVKAEAEFTMLTWNGEQVKLVLDKYKSRIKGDMCDLNVKDTIFDNKRQVCYIELRGDHYEG